MATMQCSVWPRNHSPVPIRSFTHELRRKMRRPCYAAARRRDWERLSIPERMASAKRLMTSSASLAHSGGRVAGDARRDLERQLKKTVVSELIS
jgi:ribosomal protein L4